MNTTRTVTLDVREDIRSGRDPFGRILQVVHSLKDGQELRLVAPFQPLPLVGILAQRGYAHEMRQLDGEDWEVRFFRKEPGVQKTEAGGSSRVCTGKPTIELEAPAETPDQVLDRILETVATMPAQVTLRVISTHRPTGLSAKLKRKGFCSQIEIQEDGTYVTLVRKMPQ